MKMAKTYCGRAAEKGGRIAFTLLEVMIAVVIFFMALFSILGVLSSELHAASLLRSNGPTAGMVAGQISLTNKLYEGSDAGDFGEIYQGYHWVSQVTEAATNGLFRVDIQVMDPNGTVQSTLSTFFYRPASPSGHLGLQ